MKFGYVAVVFAVLASPAFADRNETNDPKILHAIGAMIELKLKPSDITMVRSGTWQTTDQPLSCVYFRKGKTEKAAIAAVGQVKVVSANGREQATLCYPSQDMTGAVKFFAPTYLE
jgi:glutamate 5-kinase